MSDPREGASVSIPVIQFVDREIEKERLLTQSERERLREVVMARFESIAQANDLAYRELQRRLDVLNHNHEEMNKRNAFFMPRENFEQFFEDYGKWRDQVNNFQSNLIGKISLGIGLVGVVLFLLSHYWR